jgi:hypothetical protein
MKCEHELVKAGFKCVTCEECFECKGTGSTCPQRMGEPHDYALPYWMCVDCGTAVRSR